jgi:hypothetical protein
LFCFAAFRRQFVCESAVPASPDFPRRPLFVLAFWWVPSVYGGSVTTSPTDRASISASTSTQAPW